MKLNYELIRNLLLTAEDKENNSSLSQKELDEFIDKFDYTFDELTYHLKRLEEADYIDVTIRYASNQVYIYALNYITWDGHQFLDTIRSDKVWSTSKKVANDLKVKSISAFTQIAFQVASNLISNYLSFK
ncbi:DUF2513 domain-containing protein [Gemella massiliensis]|uniref:DUF2513 domain-containing protein n=1 Tax=Gemella massiliensis TaxID=1909670 RepID=UPI0009303CDE|nr:DUF2513 domain-containing protein [Gemella massiliensis]